MAMDILKMLRETAFAEGLTDEEIAVIASVCTERHFSQDDEIFSEASTGSELYIVCKGRVSLEVSLPNRPSEKQERLTTATIGMVFGELSLVDGTPRSARARAIEDTIVVELTSSKVHPLLEQYPRIGYVVMRNLATLLATRLRSTNLWLRNELLWSR